MLREDDRIPELIKEGKIEEAREMALALFNSGEMSLNTYRFLIDNTDILGREPAVRLVGDKLVIYEGGFFEVIPLDSLDEEQGSEEQKNLIYDAIFNA